MGDGELEAMQVINEAMLGLDDDARGRVIRWIAEKHDISGIVGAPRSANGAAPAGTLETPLADGPEAAFSDIGDLMHATGPSDGPARALVVAYWLQVIEGKASWGGGEINDALKNLGHGLANVTTTLNSLISKRPALVMQMSKTGRSRQARKTYKLTTAGVERVRRMVDGDKGVDE